MLLKNAKHTYKTPIRIQQSWPIITILLLTIMQEYYRDTILGIQLNDTHHTPAQIQRCWPVTIVLLLADGLSLYPRIDSVQRGPVYNPLT